MVENKRLVKIVAIGSPNTLKTGLVRTMTHSSNFSYGLPRDNIFMRKYETNDTTLGLVMFDIRHIGPYKAGTFEKASGIIIVFSKGDRESYLQIESLYQDYCAHITEHSVPIYLIGCKEISLSETERQLIREKRKQTNQKSVEWLEKKADRYNITPEAMTLVTEELTRGTSRTKKVDDIKFYDEVVSTSEGQEQAAKMGAAYYEVNLKTDDLLIEDIFHDIINNLPEEPSK